MGVPAIATTTGARRILKTAPEKKGHLMSGGRRKTYRHSKKTHKRKH